MRKTKNNKYKSYVIGMVEANPSQIKKDILMGKNFRITFKKMLNTLPLNCITEGDKTEICPNVVIHAADERITFGVLFLIAASLQIIKGGGQLWSSEEIDYKELNSKNGTKLSSLCSGGVYKACVMATKASYGLSYKYAIHKLNHSYQIFSLPFIEYDPFHSDVLPKTTFLSDYVKFENAIVLAYSTIEELGLQINTNKEHPASRPKGVWDESLKLNLKNRLQKKKIPLQEKVIWILRGRERFLDQKFKSEGQSTPWTRLSIRDKELNVMDAICEASFLRSSVSSHASSSKNKHKLVKCLMPYDVENLQFLARYLLMSSLNVWKLLMPEK